MLKIYFYLSVMVLGAVELKAQTGSEIILFDLQVHQDSVILSNGVNITNHKGYDNQPFFHPTKPLLYYASFNDSGRSDLKIYALRTKKTTNLTTTQEREYSPTVIPGTTYISCIIQRDNGEQNLGKYPMKGGSATVLIKDLVVGYHAWVNQHQVLLFVLGDSLHPNTLHYYDVLSKKDTILAENIGRSLHKIPGTRSMSFVQRVSEKELLIKTFDPITKQIKTITNTIPAQDHLTWLNDHQIMMSDGKALFVYDRIANKGWQPVIIHGDQAMLKGISRLAVNATSNRLAVVVSE